MGKFKEKDIENMNKEAERKEEIIDILFWFLIFFAIILFLYQIWYMNYTPPEMPDWNFTLT